MTRIAVGPADELQPGDRAIVDTDRGEVGVFNVDGEYYALLNTCLHQRGPVCTGKVLPLTTGEYVGLGERVEERFADEAVVKCPWHGWEYRLDSGDLVGGNVSLPRFDVVVENDTIFVEV